LDEVTATIFLNNGRRFHGSLIEGLKEIYPKYNWKKKRSNGYWNSADNRRHFVKSLEAKLHIKTPQDWMMATRQYIIDAGGKAWLNRYNWELKSLTDQAYVTTTRVEGNISRY
jgi:hypothetical protein